MGKPVLTTPVGLVGIDGAGDENIIVADEALLPARLNELLLDRQRFEAIGHGGRKLVMERYAASVNRLRLNSLVEGT
jgi:glycosyltransferase involved in cell wall biosynthesis